MMNNFHLLALLVVLLITAVKTTDYTGCFGESSDCCSEKVELFPDDKLTLSSASSNTGNVGRWCDRVIIVRRNSDNYDECTGCSLTLQFSEYSEPFPATVELLQANYSTASYFSSEMLYLEPVGTYGLNGEEYFPGSVRSPGTVLKIAFTDSDYQNRQLTSTQLVVVVTANVPTETTSVNIIVGITVPLVILFIVFNVVIYKLRQRRLALMREQLRSRLTAIVVDAALDAAILQQARARQRDRSTPHSPDPTDSVAPPSYAEAAPPPPAYEDVVLEDSAAPDTGRDNGQLIIDG